MGTLQDIERITSFEELVFSIFSKKVESVGYDSKASVSRSSGGDALDTLPIMRPDINMIDRDHISKFVEIVRFRVHISCARKGIAASFSTLMTDMMLDLKSLPYVMSVSVDSEFSERVGMPVTWVYTQDFSVRVRRGIDWKDVYDGVIGH